jgi:hypothetical protein
MRYAVWYHGTWRENIPGIAARGLTAAYYGADYQGFGVPYHVLAKDREQAALGDRDVVITVNVAEGEAADYLTCLGRPACCQGLMSGLLQSLPPRMIAAIENL